MIGTRIGKYLIKSIMGEGGMGRVYLAVDEELDREVAIKSLNPLLTAEPGFRERFKSEAKAMARLNHPGVVTVYDFLDDGSTFYIVMEKVDGIRLIDLINRYPEGMPLLPAIRIFLKILDAVDYAHRQGVIHRDLKPANILVTIGDAIKVLDFGIAKLIGEKQLTASGATFGSAHFMSPEQIMNPAQVDHRTDVYSLGIVLYEMLTSRVPFDGETDYAIKHAHVDMPTPQATNVRADLPLWVDDAIAKALEKDPDNRYSGCSAFMQEIGKKEALLAKDIAGGAYGGAYAGAYGGASAGAYGGASAGAYGGAYGGDVHIPDIGIHAGDESETTIPEMPRKPGKGGKKPLLARVIAASLAAAVVLAIVGFYYYNTTGNRNMQTAKPELQAKPDLQAKKPAPTPVMAAKQAAEPAKAEQAKAEPAKGEQAKAEPAKAEPNVAHTDADKQKPSHEPEDKSQTKSASSSASSSVALSTSPGASRNVPVSVSAGKKATPASVKKAVPATLASKKTPESPPAAPAEERLKITAWPEKKAYKEGEKIVVFMKSNKPCVARVVYEDVEGKLFQLFPNAFNSNNKLAANVTYRIPSSRDKYSIEVSPPFGQEKIHIFASTVAIGDVPLQAAGDLALIKTDLPATRAKTRSITIKPDSAGNCELVGGKTRSITIKPVEPGGASGASANCSAVAETAESEISVETQGQ